MEVFSCSGLRVPVLIWRVGTLCAGCECMDLGPTKAKSRGETSDSGPGPGLRLSFENEDYDFGLGWVGAVIAAVMRNFDEMFSRPRGNLANCVLRQINLERLAESGSAPGLDDRVAEHPVRSTSSSG